MLSPTVNPVLKAASDVGTATRWGAADLDDKRRTLAAERIAAYIRKVVDSAPPLTSEQRDRLAVLLRGAA